MLSFAKHTLEPNTKGSKAIIQVQSVRKPVALGQYALLDPLQMVLILDAWVSEEADVLEGWSALSFHFHNHV